jgi:hypothetical protein
VRVDSPDGEADEEYPVRGFTDSPSLFPPRFSYSPIRRAFQ